MDNRTELNPNFGKNIHGEFLFSPNYLNLNHGSFGTYPRAVRDSLRKFQDEAEQRPDPFLRYDYPQLLDKSRSEVAQLLNADVDELVFVPNATTAINIVLRNLEFKKGDVIIYFATIYGSCEKTIEYVTETTAAETRKINYNFPVSDAWMVNQFRVTINDVRKEGKTPRIAIFDTVVSMPGVRMPYERLLQVCHDEGVLSFVDAAHAVGMLRLEELNLGRLKPDFFVSNLHKWLFVPRGCAIFYVAKHNQRYMRSSLPTSHGFTPRAKPGAPPIISPLPASAKLPFVTNFEFVGTMDNAPYLCTAAAITWRRDRLGGEDVIAEYLVTLAKQAGELVSKRLGTEVMENEEGTLGLCAFSNVRLPLDFEKVSQISDSPDKQSLGGKVRDWMSLVLVKEYGTFMAFMWYAGAWWVRLSAQVYLEVDDFQRAADMLLEVCERVQKGEFKNGLEVSKL